MHLIVSLSGSVNFDSTRAALVASPKFAPLGHKDFGAGAELYAQCPGCNRQLPTALMHLDHIRSQFRHAQTLMQPGTLVVVLDAQSYNVSTTHAAEVQGGVTQIFRLGGDYQRDNTRKRKAIVLDSKPIHTKVAWENDLSNLQWLCMCCNTGKQEKRFEEKFPGKVAMPFVK